MRLGCPEGQKREPLAGLSFDGWLPDSLELRGSTGGCPRLLLQVVRGVIGGGGSGWADSGSTVPARQGIAPFLVDPCGSCQPLRPGGCEASKRGSLMSGRKGPQGSGRRDRPQRQGEAGDVPLHLTGQAAWADAKVQLWLSSFLPFSSRRHLSPDRRGNCPCRCDRRM